MINVLDAFASTYITSRIKFLEAAATASLHIESFNTPNSSKDGEVKALDMALQRAQGAENLLIVNSANAKGDSFAGSGVQVFLLHDAEWMAKVRLAGISVLYLHGFDQSLPEVVQKHVKTANKVFVVDISSSHSFKNTVFEALSKAKLADKCKFTSLKTIPMTEPVWQGQTVSMARQTLFKAIDQL